MSSAECLRLRLWAAMTQERTTRGHRPQSPCDQPVTRCVIRAGEGRASAQTQKPQCGSATVRGSVCDCLCTSPVQGQARPGPLAAGPKDTAAACAVGQRGCGHPMSSPGMLVLGMQRRTGRDLWLNSQVCSPCKRRLSRCPHLLGTAPLWGQLDQPDAARHSLTLRPSIWPHTAPAVTSSLSGACLHDCQPH